MGNYYLLSVYNRSRLSMS